MRLHNELNFCIKDILYRDLKGKYFLKNFKKYKTFLKPLPSSRCKEQKIKNKGDN